MTVTPPQQLAGVRKLVVERAAGCGLALPNSAAASAGIQVIFHQYIHQGSPKHLGEDIRHRLALLLGVDEQQLREASSRPVAVARPGRPIRGSALEVMTLRRASRYSPKAMLPIEMKLPTVSLSC